MSDAESGVWTCGHCGQAGPAHSMPGHPSYSCLFDPVWKPISAPTAAPVPAAPNEVRGKYTKQLLIECEWPQDESLDPEQNYEAAYAEAMREHPRTKLVYQGNRFPAPNNCSIYIWSAE